MSDRENLRELLCVGEPAPCRWECSDTSKFLLTTIRSPSVPYG